MPAGPAAARPRRMAGRPRRHGGRASLLRGLLPLLLVALAGCRGDTPAESFPGAPIVVISIDTLRSDRLPAYGYRAVETPAIDALAAEGIVYERAYTHYPLTLPAHVSLFSGQLPPAHGVRDNVGYPFTAADHPYLPRLLREAGYATGAAVSAFVLRAETGIGESFDFYESHFDRRPEDSLDRVQRSGSDTARLALDWVRQQGERPFLLFFHIYEPHAPYEAPEPFASRYPQQPYDAEVAASDAIVGELAAELRRLGVWDRAVVVLLSDHGEGLGDHGEEQHGIFLYREALQVPMLLKLPGGQRAGSRVATPVQLVDVMPTLLDLAGLPQPDGLAGRSLLASADRPEPRVLYAETYYPRLHFGWSELRSGIGDRFHYIEAPEPELYDLLADPAETANVLARERRAYAELREAVAAQPRELAAPGAVDPATAQQLAALGYVSGGSIAGGDGPRPDPKSQRGVIADLGLATEAASRGDHARAAELFGRILEAQPEMPDVWAFYGRALEKSGRREEAVAAWEKALAVAGAPGELALGVAGKMIQLGETGKAEDLARALLAERPAEAHELLVQAAIVRGDLATAERRFADALVAGEPREPLRLELGRALAEAGRPQAAVAVLAPLAESGQPPSLNTLAIALSDAGRQEEAAAVLRRSLTRDPANAVALQTLGMVALRQRRPAEARDHLRRALELNPNLPIAWNTLGVALFELEGPDAALAAWQRAVELDAQQYDALFNSGLVAARAGRTPEAREALRRFVATAPPERFAADLTKARAVLRELGG